MYLISVDSSSEESPSSSGIGERLWIWLDCGNGLWLLLRERRGEEKKEDEKRRGRKGRRGRRGRRGRMKKKVWINDAM